jgi:hypothetical protein
MPNEVQWRVAQRRTDTANAGSWLEYRAHDRIAELLHEAAQERLAGLARGGRPSWYQNERLMHRLPYAALSAMAVLARRLVAARPGNGQLSDP